MRRWLLKMATTIASGLGLTDPRLYTFFGGGPTFAGENITIEGALRIDAVWACVRLIALTISTLPLELYQKLPDGRGQVVQNHPLRYLIHDQPNAYMTAVTFWTAIVSSMLLWGNAYAEVDRRADGTVTSLIPLLPGRLQVIPQADGSLVYRYSWMGVVKEYDETQIVHFKGFSLDGIMGLSPISQARESLGTAIAAEKSAASFFRNSMRPSLVLSAPTYLNETQQKRFDEKWVAEFSGSINAGKVPLMQGGWSLEQIAMNPDDAQLLATRGFSVEQICRWYGVSPVMIGHMEKTTAWGTGLEQMNLWFLTYTLRPYLRAMEQEIAKSVMTAAQRVAYYVEFNVEGLLRTDSEKRAATMASYVNAGINTANEMRAKNNDGPLDGGDQLTVAAGRMPLEGLGQQPAPQPPQPPTVPSPPNTPPSARLAA
jgi:HK97 family phage portal protein